MNKRIIGGLLCGLMMVPMAAAWGQSPYRHMPVHAVGHHIDNSCCDSGGSAACCPDPCGPRCCVPLIPAVLNGVDRLLSHIFCGRCYDPCCAPVASGCSDCGGGHSMVAGEMEFAARRHGPTPAGITRAQQTWDIPRGSTHRMTRSPGKPTPGRPVAAENSVMKPKTAQAPQPRPAMKAQPDASRPVTNSVAKVTRAEASEAFRETSKVQQTSFQTTSGSRTPNNPLR